MPIKQERMLDLIAAAEDYENGLSQLVALIRSSIARASSGEITPAQALFEEIALQANVDLMLTRASKSAATIASERRHFQLRRRRNERETERLRERRLLSPGLQPAQRHKHQQKGPIPLVDLSIDKDDPENFFGQSIAGDTADE